MTYLILRIARLLRQSGIFVGPGEILDCLRLLDAHEDLETYEFYDLINATMVKASWGTNYVMWLCELYLGRDLETATGHHSSRPPGTPPAPKGSGPPSSREMAQALSQNDFKRVVNAFREMNLALPPHVDDRDQALDFYRRACGWLEARRLIREGEKNASVSPEEARTAQKRLRDWDTLIQTEVDHQMLRNMSTPILMAELAKRNPRTESFVSCGGELLEDVRREVLRLGQKLATRKGRRMRPRPCGTISLARTIRQSMKTCGVPLALSRVAPVPTRPDLWLICDVSNSVRQFVYFIMLLVYSAQKSFSNIRSFLFVDNLLESTDYFRNHDIEQVLCGLKALKGMNATGFSNYGRVLHQFAGTVLEELTPRTTVLILGDGKNNGHSDNGLSILPRIRQQANSLYWLTPFGEETWGQGDCLMPLYSQCCTKARPCANVRELEEFLSLL